MTAHTLNQVADGWMAWVSGVIVQASVVALMALVIVRCSKYLPANFKYVLLLIAMVKFFTPPFAGLPVGVFSQFTSSIPAHDQTAALDPDTPDHLHPVDFPVTEVDERDIALVERSELTEPNPTASTFSRDISESSSSVRVSKEAATITRTSSIAVKESSHVPRLNTAARLMLGWLIGAIVLMLRFVQGAVSLSRIVKQSSPASGEIECNFALVAKSIGVCRARLLLSPESITPMACGLFRPAVVTPQSLIEQLTPDELRAIFAHELAHHRRFDPLILWIQWSFVAIWWFHPLAWILNRTLLRLREQCCDDLVIIEKLATREAYGAALLRAVEWCSFRRRILEYAAPQMYSLKDRIISLIDPRTKRAARLSLWNWATVAMIGLIILPGFSRLAPDAVASPQAKDLDANTKPDSVIDQRLCIVGGRVLNEQGLPINAKVWLETNGGREGGFQSCKTDNGGRYQFANVEPGWTTVAALGDGYSHTGVLFTLQESRIEKNLNLIATKPKTLNLNIRNEQGEPVAGVELQGIQWNLSSLKPFGLYPKLMEAEQIGIPRSDVGGLLSIPRLPANVNCTVYLKHPDYVREMLENVPVDQTVTVTLKAGYPVIVNAIDAETSAPVTDATVSISGSPRAMNVTDAEVAEDGTYRTRLPVQTDHLTVTVSHPNLSTNEVTREYRDGIVHYDAKLYRRGVVRGRVIDESTGDPVAGLQVHLTKQSVRISQAVTGEDGTFELPAPAGSYFRVSVPGGNGFYAGVYNKAIPDDHEPSNQVLTDAPQVHVKVKPGETVVLADMTVNKLPKIKGVVLMPDGQPAAGVLVHGDRWSRFYQTTDANGRFELSGQHAGQRPYMIHLKAYHLTQPLIADAGISLKEWFAGTEIKMRLQPAADVKGNVLGQDDRPVAGVGVSLMSSMCFGPPGKPGTMCSTSRAASSITDENGNFRFTGLSRDMSYSAVIGEPFSEQTTRTNWLQPPLTSTEFKPIRIAAAPPAANKQTIARIATPVQSRHWLNSPAITNEATKGKVVLLHFCDTTNTKSIEQLVATQEIHDLYKDTGCVVIGVFRSSVSEASLKAIANEHHISFPLALDNAAGETFNAYDVNYVPNFVLIGRDGRIISDRVADYDLLIEVRNAVLDPKSGA
ncbi:MAG: M56 family metallopeptidase [Planctomycetaceae bacterium]